MDMQLQRLEAQAQAAADREGAPMVIINLNGAGRRLLVIRSATVLRDGELPYSGPFNPQAGD